MLRYKSGTEDCSGLRESKKPRDLGEKLVNAAEVEFYFVGLVSDGPWLGPLKPLSQCDEVCVGQSLTALSRAALRRCGPTRSATPE
jgi:hypothetical protein